MILLFLMAALFVGVPVGLMAALFLMPSGKFSSEPHYYEVTNPGHDFTRNTGLDWPESTRVVTAGEVRLEFLGDGEYYLVFDAPAQTLDRWLEQSAPWDAGEWQQGPVPEEIPRFFHFGVSGMSAPPQGTVAARPIDEEQIKRLLTSTATRYVAHQRSLNSWNNGEILLLDLRRNRVWYSRWDL